MTLTIIKNEGIGDVSYADVTLFKNDEFVLNSDLYIKKDIIPFWWEVYSVPGSCAEFKEGLAFCVKYGRLSGGVSVNRDPLIPVTRVPGYRVDRTFFTWMKNEFINN